ncbi:MAG: cupin domain-containing protein [Chitinophaga sp.]|jgi:quercetin dioxygenase-like cupin family protein|nr:cupin domain-containing protein [Chitinophaga sp.]
MNSAAFQFNDEIAWQDVGSGIQRQMFGYDDKVMLVKVKFEAGAIGAMHSHHHSQVTYVEEGVFNMTIGNETKRIKKGDGYYVLPHVTHGITCIEPGILIDVFSPMREDFLK